MSFYAFILAVFTLHHCFLTEIVAAEDMSYSFVAKTLGSNMVLQRDVAASLYGYSAFPSVTVFLSMDSLLNISTVSAGGEGEGGGYFWILQLPPHAGDCETHTFSITSSGGESALLTNVLFGDVFLCGGQSNMMFALPGIFNSSEEIKDADNFPYIRIFSVGNDDTMPQWTAPVEDLFSVEKPWLPGSSGSVDSGSWDSWFSAVCWLTAKEIFRGPLRGEVPVGAISSNWPGTKIESWVSPECINSCLQNKPAEPPTSATLILSGEEDFDHSQPSVLYWSMIYPFRHMKINGVFWYQGESNVGSHSDYACLQEGLVSEWRKVFSQNFSFIYTQLAVAQEGKNIVAGFRNMQHGILQRNTPRVGMITAADLGDPESPYEVFHPRNKSEVGRRMALAASSIIYGLSVPYTGPNVESIILLKTNSSFGNGIRVIFEKFSCGDGLHLEAPQMCLDSSLCGEVLLVYAGAKKIVATVLIGADGCSADFQPSSPQDEDPTSLEYTQGDYPLMVIYNSLGVPAVPFIADL